MTIQPEVAATIFYLMFSALFVFSAWQILKGHK